MARRLVMYLKDAWTKEPVWVSPFTIGGLAIILSAVSPFTKYATMINQAMPYNYPAYGPHEIGKEYYLPMK
uniref:NADH dehydrogenase [ubiquinone] 1 alpha subcomplex subunit 3 n=1 Tax=Lynx canadensis TaxID=61383 RepID=A0A667GM23_LYNCA